MIQSSFFHPIRLGALLAVTLGAGLSHAELIPVKSSTVAGVPADSIVNNTLLTADKIWTLKGFVIVKAGVTLTIEAGTTIQGDATTRGTLMVDRGAKLIARGTAEKPIRFKGPTEERGAWGGIVLLGKAVSNQGYDATCPSCTPMIQYEALNWATYGGSDPHDNSGVLEYVTLDGPGFPVDLDKELNGLTMCAVGDGTVINHVQVHRGDDDGFEWFGGSVNTSHLVVTQETDDAFDLDHGYNGTSHHMIAVQRVEPKRPRPGSTVGSEPVGDNGVECGSSQGDLDPATHPHWSNITLIDNGVAFGPFQAKEDCGGLYEKMVLVTGGAHKDSLSAWAMNFLGDQVINDFSLNEPPLDFKDVFILGKFKDKFKFEAGGTPSSIALATEILNTIVKTKPVTAEGDYGLYSDLSPSDPEVLAKNAGAIEVGSNGPDLWYQGWTIPNTVKFDLGKERVAENAAAPVVTLAPPAGELIAPATFTLNASATDADGIDSIYILQGTAVLAKSATASVSFTVTNADVGPYTYTARAKDKHPSPLVSTKDLSVEVKPVPNVSAPLITYNRTGGNNLIEPASFTVNALAADVDGIAKLEILKDGISVASTTTTGSLSYDLANLMAGTYRFTFRAKDKHVLPMEQTEVLDVVVAAVPANVAPTLDFTRNGSTLFAPASFTLNAQATDENGVAKLEIFEGEEKLGASTSTAPNSLSIPLSNRGVGTYHFIAKVTDTHPLNPITITKEVIVEVFEETEENAAAPVINAALNTADTVIAPAAYSLIISAEDANGIDSLQILENDEILITTTTSISLTYPITGKAVGTYIYTVRAKDKHADAKESTKEIVVVVKAPAPNDAPILTVNGPGDETLHAPAGFTIQAVAGDAQGIDSIWIFLGETLIKAGAGASLSATINNMAAGEYVYTIRAKDKHATDAKTASQTITVKVEPAIPTRINVALQDLNGIRSLAGRGRDLVIESEGYGRINMSVWSLAGNRITSVTANLQQGQNSIPVGNLRGLHFVRMSDGKTVRTARVLFNAKN
jgi:hypothetical protein